MELFKIYFSAADLMVIAPELVLTIVALSVLILSVFIPGEKRSFLGYTALIGVIVAFLSFFLVVGKELSAFNGMVTIDPFSSFFKILFLIIALLTILASLEYARRAEIDFG